MDDGEKTRGDDDLYGNFSLRPKGVRMEGKWQGCKVTAVVPFTPKGKTEGLEVKRHETWP